MGSIYEDERENSANHRRAERASMLLEVSTALPLRFVLHTGTPADSFTDGLVVVRARIRSDRVQDV